LPPLISWAELFVTALLVHQQLRGGDTYNSASKVSVTNEPAARSQDLYRCAVKFNTAEHERNHKMRVGCTRQSSEIAAGRAYFSKVTSVNR